MNGLGIEHHDTHLARFEVAALVQCRDQLLVAEVPVAEIPADGGAGDTLTVGQDVVVLVVADHHPVRQGEQRPPVRVEGAKRISHVHRNLRGFLAAVELLQLSGGHARDGDDAVGDLRLRRRLDAPQRGVPVPRVVTHAGQEGKKPWRGNGFRVTPGPATTANSNIGSGVVKSASPIEACPTNSASTLNIMKTFHSSGTPIGIDDKMPKWKQSMTNAAIAVGQPPWLKNKTSGTNPSIAVLKCASHRERQPGRRSSGKCSKNWRLMNRGRNIGLLLIIVEMTNGKCLLSLDVAAPSQMTRHTSFAPKMRSTP